MKKMPDFYLSVGLVDENFINELSPVLLRCSIKLSEDSRKGLLKEGLEGSKPRKWLFKKACKAENSEGVVERGLDFEILVGCGVVLTKRTVLISFRTISGTRLPISIK